MQKEDTRKACPLSFLAENDVESEENTLILSRRISRDGKNSCRVNGYPVPLSLLRALGERLVNIHGQMDSKNLLDADRHFVYIDAFGNLSDLLAAYQADYRRLCDIRSEMKRLYAVGSENGGDGDAFVREEREAMDVVLQALDGEHMS